MSLAAGRADSGHYPAIRVSRSLDRELRAAVVSRYATWTMHRPATAADPADLDAFLEAHPGTAFFEIFFTNLAGVPRGKRVRRAEIAAVYAHGCLMPGSVLVVDVTGRDLEDDTAGWLDGDADRLAWPVAGGLSVAPWLGDDTAQVMLTMHELDGAPCALDPRHILQRVLDRFTADRLTPVVACELEFYLVDAVRAADGGIQQPVGSDGRRPTNAQVFGLDGDDLNDGYLRALWAACDAMHVPAGTAISEYAPGQLEVTLAHCADALAACDDAVRFKRAAKGLAAAHDRSATFMAKPFAANAGSGLHFHISINDPDGRNIFAADAADGTTALRHCIGGAAAAMGDAMAVFAPNANSYRRFHRHSDNPLRASWGVNNRTAPLRVPAGTAASRRLEHRISGADANPYLAAAAALAGVHDGRTQRIDPGPPVWVTGDGATGERLPTDWAYAIERFDRSAMLRDYLGDRAVALYAAIKRAEQARFNAVVTPLDFDWLLRSA